MNGAKEAVLSKLTFAAMIAVVCIPVGFAPSSKSAEWIRTLTTRHCIYEVDIESRVTVPPGITSYNTRSRCKGETGPIMTGYAMCKEKPPLVKETMGGWIPIHEMVRYINTDRGTYDVLMHGAPTVCQYEGIR